MSNPIRTALDGFLESPAKSAALQSMTGRVMLQSTVLSFEHIFLLAGALFLLVLPLLYFLRAPRIGPAAPPDVHVEI